jgi:hypothetical protein
MSRRHVEVEDINWDEDLMGGKLVAPETFIGQYRNFRLDRMVNVLLKQ